MNRLTKICFSMGIICFLNSSLAFAVIGDNEEGSQESSSLKVRKKKNARVEDLLPRRSALLEQNLASSSSPTAPISRAIDRPMSNTVIPEIAHNYEDVYKRFLKGVLVYRSDAESNKGMIELRIADLANPLKGEFDLSGCGDMGEYLRFYTGCRKKQKTKNELMLEISITPWFLAKQALHTLPSNHHMHTILPNWNQKQAPIGIFWTWQRSEGVPWHTSPGFGLERCSYVTDQPLLALCYGRGSCFSYLMLVARSSDNRYYDFNGATRLLKHFTLRF